MVNIEGPLYDTWHILKSINPLYLQSYDLDDYDFRRIYDNYVLSTLFMESLYIAFRRLDR